MFSAKFSFIAAALALATSVHAHGKISSPTPRKPGPQFAATCGDQDFNQLNSDPYGNQQGLQQNQPGFASNENCKLYQCLGLSYEDNTSLLQSYPAGTVVPMKIEIRAPHTGVANVSVINLATNSIIGSPLFSIENAYNNAVPMDQQEGLNFDVTIPDLGSECATAGACALQWWWDARSIDQTYMSCIDFTQDGSGSPAPAPTTTAAPETTTAAPEPTTTVEETSAVPEPTTSVEEPVPTTSVEEPVPTTSVEEPIPTTSVEEPVPTTSVEEPVPTTSAEEPEPTTIEEPEPTTAAPEPTSSTLSAPISSFTSVRPTTFQPAPPTTSADAPAPAPTGAQDANQCWRTYNKCLDASQPKPDFTGCGATRDTCLAGARYQRLARSATIGRRML